MSAIISPCGLYRYRLERDQLMPALLATNEQQGKTIAFFGVNPSTADASLDDATVRKWTGFCRRWGAARFIVGNVFAFRSTDVKALRTQMQVVGPDNFAHMEQIAADADVLVPCWGDRGKVPKSLHHHIDKTRAFLAAQGKPMLTFGLTAGGDPKHPLMLAYDTPLTEWSK